MRMTLQYASGVRIEAVILAADRARMRVAIASQRGTAELRRIGECWYTERLEIVQIESIFQVPGIDASEFCLAIYPLTARAPYKS